MTDEEIKNQLKQLLSIKELSIGFKSQQDCIDWSNKVAPLLKFNEDHYQAFRERCAIINTIGLSGQLQRSTLNQMVSTAKQALFELENNIVTLTNTKEPSEDLPKKITIPWLFRNLNITVWGLLVTAVFGVFVAGIKVGQIDWVKDLLGKGAQIKTETELEKDKLIKALTTEIQQVKDETTKSNEQMVTRIENDYKERIAVLTERIDSITKERNSLNTQYMDLYKTYQLTLTDNDRQAARAREMLNLRKQEQLLQEKIDSISTAIKEISNEIGKTEQPCSEYKQGKNWYFAGPNDCENFNKAKYQLETLKQDLAYYKEQIRYLRENIKTTSK